MIELVSDPLKIRLVHALRCAKEKLAIYRAERGGEYTGGREYGSLKYEIDAALRMAKEQGYE